MKLGMTSGCYRWDLSLQEDLTYTELVEGHQGALIRSQRQRPEFNYMGHPIFYFSSVPSFLSEEESLMWLIRHTADLGLTVLCASFGLGQALEPGALKQIKQSLAEGQVEIVPIVSLNWAAEDYESEVQTFLPGLETAEALGATVVCTTHSRAVDYNHFTHDPPVEQQLDRATRLFTCLGAMAAERKMVIALENHMDYTSQELVSLIKAVNSPWVRATLDTGNPIALIEDPVDAATRLAPYTVLVHFKDLRIQPITQDGVPMIFGAPIGRGHIDLASVLEILQTRAPDSQHLPLCLDLVPHRTADSQQWVRGSFDYIRTHFERFLI